MIYTSKFYIRKKYKIVVPLQFIPQKIITFKDFSRPKRDFQVLSKVGSIPK